MLTIHTYDTYAYKNIDTYKKSCYMFTDTQYTACKHTEYYIATYEHTVTGTAYTHTTHTTIRDTYNIYIYIQKHMHAMLMCI